MRKKISLAFVLVFIAFLLVSCSINNNFDDFSMLLFKSQASSDSLTLHYTVKNPDVYGISANDRKAPLGRFPLHPDSACAALENTLAALHRFDRQGLSDSRRLTFDILEYYLEASLFCSTFHDLSEPLKPLTGIQAQLPLLFSEYAFYGEQDVLNYFKLLSDLPAYFDSVALFEREKARGGTFMSREQCDSIISECRSFLAMGSDHYLFSSFSDRIQSLSSSVSQSKMRQYVNQNSDYVNKYVFLSYKKLVQCLSELRSYAAESAGLSKHANGKAYYESLVICETGSDRPITELASLIQSQMREDLLAVKSHRGSFDLPEFEDSNPFSMLNHLRRDMAGDFPALMDCRIEIKYVPSDLSAYMSPAFYLIPPIDAPHENTIYINPPLVPDDLSLFTTLAHEGYPGHLYQTVYFSGTSPAPIRMMLDFGGYTEGWATYCEMMSFYYAPIPSSLAFLLQHNASLILGAYAYADLGIHYYSWSFDDLCVFFRQYGVSDPSVLREIYLAIVSNPANYLKYYAGYLEFLELKKEAIRNWGDDFSQSRFHTEVLRIGPAPFSIIRRQLFS